MDLDYFLNILAIKQYPGLTATYGYLEDESAKSKEELYQLFKENNNFDTSMGINLDITS